MVRILENQQKNIYMSRFWNFHKFIENKFLSWLSKNNIDYNDIESQHDIDWIILQILTILFCLIR